MKVTRREFFNYCAGSAAALGLASTLGPLEKALAATSGPPIIWIKGSSCTGCTVSLANRISTSAPVDLADLLIHTIDLVYNPALMGAAGDLAVQTLQNAAAGPFILAVEGGIPTLYNGKTCTIYSQNGVDVTALAAVQQLAPKAVKVLSIGTCASFGGMAAANPNPTQIKSLSAATGVSTINIPGCPPHPLTILALGLYDQVLPNQNGAPVRLVVPWKYGYKSAKSIVEIRFVETQPRTAWEKANPNAQEACSKDPGWGR